MSPDTVQFAFCEIPSAVSFTLPIVTRLPIQSGMRDLSGKILPFHRTGGLQSKTVAISRCGPAMRVSVGLPALRTVVRTERAVWKCHKAVCCGLAVFIGAPVAATLHENLIDDNRKPAHSSVILRRKLCT